MGSQEIIKECRQRLAIGMAVIYFKNIFNNNFPLSNLVDQGTL